MPSRTAWDRELGTTQGRIVPEDFPYLAGTYAFVLGAAEEGHLVRLDTGDYAEVKQTGTLGGARLIRFGGRLRTNTLPAGVTWKASIRVDGVQFASRLITRSVDLVDLVANVSKLNPAVSHELAFRLTLEAQPAQTYPDGVTAWTEGRLYLDLPGFFIDAIELDSSSTDIVLVNRVPGPSEVAVPRDTLIEFDLIDVLGERLVAASTQVWVNDVLAYDGGAGGFQAGFAGGSSAITAPAVDKLHVVIEPEAEFASGGDVVVRVRTEMAEGYGVFDEDYLFTCADETVPVVSSAHAHTFKKVRVTFSEPVRQVNSSGANDALNPSNYAFAPTSSPGAPTAASSVSVVSSSVVEVTTDLDLTPGRGYRVTVTNVQDTSGNAVAAPNNYTDFTAVSYAGPRGRRLDVWEEFPQLNRSEDHGGDLRKWASLLQDPLDLLYYDLDHVPQIWDPDTAPENWVDLMLLEMGNPFNWIHTLSLTTRRKLLKTLVRIYQLKGTDIGITGAVSTLLGLVVTITPRHANWWRLGRHTLGVNTVLGAAAGSAAIRSFWIDSAIATNGALTALQQAEITKIAKYMKPAYTHLTGIRES